MDMSDKIQKAAQKKSEEQDKKIKNLLEK